MNDILWIKGSAQNSDHELQNATLEDGRQTKH
jgi:hypothetical protein